ncbi:MAG: MFS transporter [Pseudomonadota bacterium]
MPDTDPSGLALPGPMPPFAALGTPNFRRFVTGQGISLVGSWTETVAQALLVLQLTNSAVAVGLATAARYLPVLLLTPYAGLIVDRHDKRRILILTACSLALLSVLQGALVLSHHMQMWVVFVVALVFGTLSALDNPARQAFIPEMVGKGLIRNAVTINSTMVNVGRALGPLVAAGLVSTVGIGWCFLINAISFAAVLFALATMDTRALFPVKRVAVARGQVLQGLRYAATVPEIIGPIAMMALIGTFTYEFEVSLPIFAKMELNPAPVTYSWLLGAFGAGSVLGGFYCMVRPATGLPRLVRAAALYAAAMLALSFAPSLPVAVPVLIVVGLASITFITTGNSTIQLAAAPEYRGRVTGLWSTAFVGSTPIGATIIGFVAALSPRWAIVVGALACIVAAWVGWHFLGLRPAPNGDAEDSGAPRSKRYGKRCA